MLEINRTLVSYEDHLGKNVTHYVLIAAESRKQILLSHANIFLRKVTSSSIRTSDRYSSVISMFYRYLSSLDKYADISVSQYHSLFDNEDIQRWQVARQKARIDSGNDGPSSPTIFDDAKLVLGFCHWLNLNGYVTNVDVRLKTWTVNFKGDGMLNYLQQKEQTKIDSSTIRILDKESRQKRLKSLILTEEIGQLIEAYSDPVYAEMFRLSLGTALRPSEVCNFPYYGTGKNAHIMPYSSMDKNGKTVEYTAVGKGNKVRTIKINIKDLESLERNYIKPYYHKRSKKYEENYGHPPPLSLLFLNKKGVPVTASSIAVRTNAAKKKAIQKNPSFREAISFYDARHWWPTQFLITFFGDKLLTKTTDVLYAACAEVLKNQMGHESLETTYKHYIDLSRVVLMAHKGMVNEVVSEKGQSVEEFINSINLRQEIPVEIDDDE